MSKLSAAALLALLICVTVTSSEARTHSRRSHHVRMNHPVKLHARHKPTPHSIRRVARDVEDKASEAPKLIHVPLKPGRIQDQEVRVYSNPIQVSPRN